MDHGDAAASSAEAADVDMFDVYDFPSGQPIEEENSGKVSGCSSEIILTQPRLQIPRLPSIFSPTSSVTGTRDTISISDEKGRRQSIARCIKSLDIDLLDAVLVVQTNEENKMDSNEKDSRSIATRNNRAESADPDNTRKGWFYSRRGRHVKLVNYSAATDKLITKGRPTKKDTNCELNEKRYSSRGRLLKPVVLYQPPVIVRIRKKNNKTKKAPLRSNEQTTKRSKRVQSKRISSSKAKLQENAPLRTTRSGRIVKPVCRFGTTAD